MLQALDKAMVGASFITSAKERGPGFVRHWRERAQHWTKTGKMRRGTSPRPTSRIAPVAETVNEAAYGVLAHRKP
jgi:hypothetical protein